MKNLNKTLSCIVFIILYTVTLQCIANTKQLSDKIILICNSKTKKFCPSITTALHNSLADHQLKLIVINIDNIKETPNKSYLPNLIIALGNQALQYALTNYPNTDILSSFVHKKTFEKHTLHSNNSRKVAALYIEHCLERQLNFIELLTKPLSQNTSIGIIVGPDFDYNDIAKYGTNEHVRIFTMQKNINPVAALRQALQQCNIILALWDPAVFNRTTTHGLIMAALKQGIPTIGYSKPYVRSGALAALYSSKKQYAKQIANLVKEYLHDKNALQSCYPNDYTISINPHVAKALGAPAYDTQKLKASLELIEKGNSYDYSLGN